jgi:hypothetical protein
MNSQRSPIQVVWKSFTIILLVLLAFQSFGINGLAAPATSSLNFQQGDNPQLACSTSSTPLQFCDIQIVLLIDDSGSMKYNDPQGIRNLGAKNLVDFLARQYYLPAKEYLEAVKSTNNPPVIEIAVAHFTTKVEILTDWKKVDPPDPEYWKKVDPTDLEDWKNDKVAFDGAIDWNKPLEQNTDFKDPFEKAAELFTSKGGQAQDDDCTRRLILLFTDGTPQNGGYVDVDHKMLEVESIVDDIPPDLNVEIYITGFKVKEKYWDRVAPYWYDIVKSNDEVPLRSVLLGEKEGENPLRQLLIRMEEIAAHSIGVQSAVLKPDPTDPQSYTIEVPEYLQSLRLTLYDLDPKTRLMITDPSGNEIAENDDYVNLSGDNTSIEVWQLDTPVSGNYKVTPSQRGGVVTAFFTFQNLAVEVDKEASRLQISQPGDFKFKLVGSSGKAVLSNDNPSYTLEELKVFVTQGTQIEKEPLTPKQVGDSYQVSWTPESLETVQLDIEAILASDKGNTIVNCAGKVELPVDDGSTPEPTHTPTLVITQPACVPVDEATIVSMHLAYAGDRAWADSLNWDISAIAGGQDVNATVTAIDSSKGEYELRIDPIEDTGVKEIQLTVSAEAVINGQSVIISDGTTTTLQICPPCECLPIWLIFVWLIMWLVLLLLGWVILRDVEININFWLLIILEIVLAVVWFILFSEYMIYLFWMLLLIVLLIILVFIFRKVIRDISWWLIILLTLFVSIWFVLFGSFPFWLILLLLLMWLAFLILIWIFKMSEPPSWRWLLLVLLLILALVSIIYFSPYWIFLLLWLLTILVLTLVILVIGPICPPIPPPPPADDLKDLEGIEGDVEQLLNDHGIYTFRQLAEADISQLNKWLNENDWKYMDPKTWPQQAQLADIAKRYGKKSDEQSYKAYKKWLKNGIEPDEYEDKEKVRRPEALVWRGTAELTEKDNPEIFNIK